MEKGLAWGFTDTPAGALLAAVNIAVRATSQWGPPVYVPTILRQVTGPDAAALMRGVASGWAMLQAAGQANPGQLAAAEGSSITAYKFVSWNPAAATVDIVAEASGAGNQAAIAVTRVQVIWVAGDWKVIAPPGGDWAASATALTSTAGYIPFPRSR